MIWYFFFAKILWTAVCLDAPFLDWLPSLWVTNHKPCRTTERVWHSVLKSILQPNEADFSKKLREKALCSKGLLHHCLAAQDQPARRARKKPAAAAPAALAVVPDSGLAAKDSDGPSAKGPVVEPAEISVEEEAPKQRSLEERESDSDVIMEIHEVDTSVGLRHVFQSTSLFSQNDGCVSQHSTSPQRAVPNFAKWSHLDPELKMVSFPIPCQPPTIALARGWPKDRPREGDGAGWEGRLRTPSLSEIVHEPWCNWYM